jgi:hypothetical protein
VMDAAAMAPTTVPPTPMAQTEQPVAVETNAVSTPENES